MFFGDRVCAEVALVRYNDLLRRSMDEHKLKLGRARRRPPPCAHKKGRCAGGLVKQCVVK